MISSRLAVLAALAAAALPASAEALRRASAPALSPDGAVVAFSWQGDLWTVPAAGGPARRLTVHPARDTMPRWTPDGQRIVFASTRFGSTDVFVMDADGTDLRRLNHESSNEQVTAVAPDGKHVYGYTNRWGRMDVFRVPIGGGELVRLTGRTPDMELEYYPSPSADGQTVFFNSGGSAGNWRSPGAAGSNTGEIWAGRAGAPLRELRQLTRNTSNDLFPNGLPDGGVLFVSNRSGVPNLWRMNADGSGARQLTRHERGTVRWPHVAADGRTAVYEQDSDLWILDLRTGENRKLAIHAPADGRANATTELTIGAGASAYAPSPDGKRMVAVIRGDLWLMPERGGTTRRLTTSLALDGQPLWLNNQTILFVTGRNGKRELMTVGIDGVEKPFLSDALDLSTPQLSPDGKTIALHRGHNEIVVVPAEGGEVKTVLRGFFTDALRGGPAFTWAPDSAHLAADVPNEKGSTIQVVEVASGKAVTIARTPRGAATPRFLPNGRGVFFEVFGEDSIELHLVDLVPAPITFTEDDLDKLDEARPAGGPGGAGGAAAPAPAPKVTILEEGVFERRRSLGEAFGAVASADSRTLYALAETGIVAIPVAGGAASPVAGAPAGASGLSINRAGNKLYFTQAGRLYGLAPSGGTPALIPFSATLTIDLKEEERELFREIVWALERFYYDPKLHGKDWEAIKTRYAATAAAAPDREDFYAVVGEMVEELDSSHMGASPPATPPAPGAASESTGYLGVEWDPSALDARGRYRVAHVMPGTPAAHPDSRLMVGDILLRVDGVAPTAERPVAALLNQKVGRRVRLTIERDGREVEVAIRPGSSAAVSSLVYDEFVRQNRRMVDELSGGRLAYLHIQGMNAPSHARFLEEIRTLTVGKEGVVIDVRYNGGGSTAHLALGVLIKTPWLVRTFRGFDGLKVSENIYRGDSLELPSNLLINQYSFSNAEIMAEGFRRLRVGPVIGEATAGGVIGTSSWSLWDGGSIRMPSNGAYAIDGENLEGNGRKPDIDVRHDPNAWREGRDPVLERAVRDLLGRLPGGR